MDSKTNCRLCAQHKPVTQQINLENNTDTCIKIFNKLKRFNIQIDLTKNLPKTACHTCIESLDSAFAFITVVEQSQMSFEQILKQNSQESVNNNASIDSVNERNEHEFVIKEEKRSELENNMNVCVYNGAEDILSNAKETFDNRISVDNSNDSEYRKENSLNSSAKNLQTNNEITRENNNNNNLLLLHQAFNTNPNSLMGVGSSPQLPFFLLPPAQPNLLQVARPPWGTYLTNSSIKDSTAPMITDLSDNGSSLPVQLTNHANFPETNSGALTSVTDPFGYIGDKDNIKVDKEVISESADVNETDLGVGEEIDNNSDIETKDNTEMSDKMEVNGDNTGFTNKDPSWKDYIWKCRLCETLFPNIEELVKHSMENHSSCNPYQCFYCNKVISILDTFLSHLKTHRKNHKLYEGTLSHIMYANGNADFKCPGCNKTFKNKEELNEHLKIFYKDQQVENVPNSVPSIKDFICEICKRTYKNKYSLKSHMFKIHHKGKKEKNAKEILRNKNKNMLDKDTSKPNTNHNLDEEEKYISEAKLKTLETTESSETNEHIEKSSDDTLTNSGATQASWKDYTWKCRYCETLFPTIEELKEHSMEYHKACNPQQCFDCNRIIINLKKFLRHITSHRKELRMCCLKCDENFSSIKMFNKHNHSHTFDDTDFKCRGCHNTFPSQNDLDNHVKMYFKDHFIRQAPMIEVNKNHLYCKTCKRHFKTEQTLKYHIIIKHTDLTDNKMTHVCDVCGKLFLHKKQLDQHIIQHESEDKRHECQMCKHSFVSVKKLQQHAQAVHFNREKKFCCDHCGKHYRTRSNLISHMNIHKGSKLNCSYCDKKFNYSQNLKMHLRQHTGVKPYSCDVCLRYFTDASNYKKHMRRMHSVEKATKKLTAKGPQAVDPDTGKVIQLDENKVLEWKKRILEPLSKK